MVDVGGRLAAGAPPRVATYQVLLVLCAAAYAVLHHVGTLPDGLGPAGAGTRWADWIDLLTPWAVLVPAGLALRAGSAGTAGPGGTARWVGFGAGAVLYVQGHGVHLAANSIGNVAPGRTAHLWDEVVGHYLWYAGVALVVAALAASMRRRPAPASLAARLLAGTLAVAVGLTWATNAIGGGTVVASLLLALAALAYGWQHRRTLALLLAVGALPGVVVLVVSLTSLG